MYIYIYIYVNSIFDLFARTLNCSLNTALHHQTDKK